MKRLFHAFLFLTLAALGSTAQSDEPLGLDEVLFLKQMGRTEKQILESVTARGVKFRLDEGTGKKLREAGFGEAFTKEVAKTVLLQDVLAWKKEGVSEEEMVIRVRNAGITFPLNNAELLRLHKAGVPLPVIHAIQGTLSRSTLKGFVTFKHPAGLYHIQVPKEWRRLREVNDDGITFTFTPDPDATKSEEVRFGVSLMVFGTGPGAPHTYLSLDEVNDRFFKAILRQMEEEDRKRPEGERHLFRKLRSARATLAGIPAVLNHCTGRTKGVPVREWIYYAHQDNSIYVVGASAPEAEFESRLPLFRKILATFELPAGKPQRVRGEIAKPSDVVNEFKESVVRVWAAHPTPRGKLRGHGTGFFIRKDGYIFTNHHVVEHEGRISKEVWIEWDVTLGRREIPAVVVGAVRSEYPKVDVALLKVQGDHYKPFALTRNNPQGKHVREQDRILALGFPAITDKEDAVRRLTLTSTEGTVSRFVQRLDGTVNYLFMTAPIHKGNSGGPCFNLDTHSVIGLNTFGSFDPVAEQQGVLTFAAGFSGVVPIDAALEHFPEVLSYPANVEESFTADDFTALGNQYLNQGATEAAIRQFRWALRKKPDLARARASLGEAYFREGDRRRALEETREALRLDPKNLTALINLAILRFQEDREESFRSLDRAVEIAPGNLKAILLRAEFRRLVGRHEEALADAKTAEEIAQGLFSEPIRSQAETRYAMKKYEDGKRLFEAALRINSHDTEAALGSPRYYELTGDRKRATAEFARVCRRYPDDPGVALAAGNHHLARAVAMEAKKEEAQGEYKKASIFYELALGNYRKRKQLPPADVLASCGYAAFKGGEKPEVAETYYGLSTHQLIAFGWKGDQFIRRVKNKALLQLIYMRLFEVYIKNKDRRGTAIAVLRMAREVDPESAVGKQIAEAEPRMQGTLSIDECVRLLKWSGKHTVNPIVVADIVTKGDLAFGVTKEFVEKIKGKVHYLIVLAFARKVGQAAKGVATVPPDFREIRHQGGLCSFAIPKAWQGAWQSFPQVDFFQGGDAATSTGVSLYYFKNARSDQEALQTVIGMAQRAGMQIQIGKSQETAIGGYKGKLVTGTTSSTQGTFIWLAAVVPTPQGVFMLSVGAPQQQAQAQQKVLVQVLESFRVK